MARFALLLRGINVGRAKRVAMADLRALLESLGHTNVRTLLNSGNAVYDGKAEAPAKQAGRIRAAIHTELGIDALTIVKSASDMASIVAENPLLDVATDPSRLLVAMTQDSASLASIDALCAKLRGEEQLRIGAHAAYLWCADGILESKAGAALLGTLGETGTSRNWATMQKLVALLAGCMALLVAVPLPAQTVSTIRPPEVGSVEHVAGALDLKRPIVVKTEFTCFTRAEADAFFAQLSARGFTAEMSEVVSTSQPKPHWTVTGRREAVFTKARLDALVKALEKDKTAQPGTLKLSFSQSS